MFVEMFLCKETLPADKFRLMRYKNYSWLLYFQGFIVEFCVIYTLIFRKFFLLRINYAVIADT
jgi:hypothetical protein